MFPFVFDPRRSISHMLIIVCIGVSIFGFINPHIIQMYGMSRIYLDQGLYLHFIMQLVLFQFLHANFLHLFLNIYFLYQAGPDVEQRMSRRRYWAFFITTTLAVALWLCLFAPYSTTIGISGFCMALLAYLWIDLYMVRHPMSNQILIMLVINILMGLTGEISFIGHLFGAIWGIAWWYLPKKH